MTTHAITIEIDDAKLASYTDERLALFWHVAQANPANVGLSTGPTTMVGISGKRKVTCSSSVNS